MECDQVAVIEEVWNRAKAGEKEAIEQLRSELDGLELYEHALCTDSPPYTWVSIRELNEAGIVELVILKTRAFVSRTAMIKNENGEMFELHYRDRTDDAV